MATAVEVDREDEGQTRVTTDYSLYRTKGGAFFLVVNEFRGEGDDETHDTTFDPMTYDQAHQFARGERVQLGFLILPGKQVEWHVEGIFPTVAEAADETGFSVERLKPVG